MKGLPSLRQAVRTQMTLVLLLAFAAAADAADSWDGHVLTMPSLAIGSATYSTVAVNLNGFISGPEGSGPNGSVDSYNPQNNQLTVQSVSTGAGTAYNVVVTVGDLLSIGGVTGADSYDGSKLTISSVQVGDTIYTDVVVAIGLANVVSVTGGMPNAARDFYNPTSGYLLIPAVMVGSHVYTNVNVSVAIGNVVSVGGHTTVPCSAPGTSKDAWGCWDVNVLTAQAGVSILLRNSEPSGLACLPPGGAFTCIATNHGAQYTVLRNGTWSAPALVVTDPGPSMGRPSCVSGVCMEGAIIDVGLPTVAEDWLTFNGTSWTTIATGTKNTDGPETGIWACGSPSFCQAVLTTQATLPAGDSYQILTETFGGAWSGYKLYSHSYKPGLFDISCVPGTSTCVAVGGGGTPGLAAVVRFQGGALTLLSPPFANGLGSVSCPTSTFCMAVNGFGEYVTYNPSSNSFGPLQLAIPAGSYGSGHDLVSVSCGSADFCVALDLPDNTAITYVNGVWGTPAYLFGAPYFVSCPSENNCYALVNTGTSTGLAVETYTRTVF